MTRQKLFLAFPIAAVALATAPASAQLYFSTPLNAISGTSGIQGSNSAPSYLSSGTTSLADFALSAAGVSVATSQFNRLTAATSAGYYHVSVAAASTRDVFTIDKPGFGSGFMTLEFRLSGDAPTDLRDGDGGQAAWTMRYYQDNAPGLGFNQSNTRGWALNTNNGACYTNFCSQSGPIVAGNGDADVISSMFGNVSYRIPVAEGRTVQLLNQIQCATSVRSDRVLPFTCNLDLRFLGISKFETADGNPISDYVITSLSGFRYGNGISSVPEPQSWISLTLGFALIGGIVRSKRSSPHARPKV